MLPYQPFDSLESGCGDTYVICESDVGIEPELSFALGTLNVDVKTRLLSREEEEPE
jgi:hypothetical protein